VVLNHADGSQPDFRFEGRFFRMDDKKDRGRLDETFRQVSASGVDQSSTHESGAQGPLYRQLWTQHLWSPRLVIAHPVTQLSGGEQGVIRQSGAQIGTTQQGVNSQEAAQARLTSGVPSQQEIIQELGHQDDRGQCEGAQDAGSRYGITRADGAISRQSFF
jgi:hypothetical protein